MYSEWEIAGVRSATGAYDRGQVVPPEVVPRELVPREESPISRDRLESYTLQIGRSTMRFEPPDIGHVTYIGDLNGDVVLNMNAALEGASKRAGHIYLLVDLANAGDVTDEARVGGLRGMRVLNPRATAVFGADFHVRVIATLITKAASLIDARVKGPVSFFGREKEARAWLGEIRRRAGSNPV